MPMKLTSRSSGDFGSQTEGSSSERVSPFTSGNRAFTAAWRSTGTAISTSCETTRVAPAPGSRRFGTSEPATRTPGSRRISSMARSVRRRRVLNSRVALPPAVYARQTLGATSRWAVRRRSQALTSRDARRGSASPSAASTRTAARGSPRPDPRLMMATGLAS